MSGVKLVRIDVVGGVTSAVLGPFGDKVVRFTFSDFLKSYASLDAFPNEAILIKHATEQGGYVANLIANSRGTFEDDHVARQAEGLNNWAPLWIDNTLKAV